MPPQSAAFVIQPNPNQIVVYAKTLGGTYTLGALLSPGTVTGDFEELLNLTVNYTVISPGHRTERAVGTPREILQTYAK